MDVDHCLLISLPSIIYKHRCSRISRINLDETKARTALEFSKTYTLYCQLHQMNASEHRIIGLLLGFSENPTAHGEKMMRLRGKQESALDALKGYYKPYTDVLSMCKHALQKLASTCKDQGNLTKILAHAHDVLQDAHAKYAVAVAHPGNPEYSKER